MRRAGHAAVIMLLLGTAPAHGQVADTLPAPVAGDSARIRMARPAEETASACMPIGALGSLAEDRARIAQLTGARRPASELLRRSDPLRTTCTPGPAAGMAFSASLLPASIVTGLRSGYEGGRNDGALWQGRGLSAAVTGGVRLRYSILTIDVAPVLAWQQNADFPIAPIMGIDTLPGISRFANPWFPTMLDVPQRFGDDAYATLDPGNSRISATLGALELGLSTQSLWWGPGLQNALLMTNNAPGFPHVHLSTARPLDLGFAELEFSILGGQLRESAYRDTIAGNGRTFFRGLAVSLAPKVLEHLYLGAARTFVGPWDDVSAGDLLDLLFQGPFTRNVRSGENPSGNSPGNQLISFFARWVLPADRMEVWAEWGREDHAGDVEDLVQEPEHSQAWVLGFQKLLGPPGRPVRVGGEWTDLSHFTPPRPDRGYVNWYAHDEGSYTNRGQWLGSATGTGGDSQHLWVDVLWRESSLGLFGERVRRQDHAYYITRCCTTLRGHDVELTAGVRGTTSWRGLSLDAALHASHRYNRQFLGDRSDFGVRLGAGWWPRTDR